MFFEINETVQNRAISSFYVARFASTSIGGVYVGPGAKAALERQTSAGRQTRLPLTSKRVETVALRRVGTQSCQGSAGRAMPRRFIL